MPDLLTVDSSILRRVLGIDIFRTFCKSLYTLFWEFWSEEKREVKESNRVQVWETAVVILNSCQESFSTPSLAPQPSQLSPAIHQKASGFSSKTVLEYPSLLDRITQQSISAGRVSVWGLLFSKRNQCLFDHIPIVPTDSWISPAADWRQSWLAKGRMAASINPQQQH